MKKSTPEKKGTFLTDTFQVKIKEKTESIFDKSPKRLNNIQTPVEEYIATRNVYTANKDFQRVKKYETYS